MGSAARARAAEQAAEATRRAPGELVQSPRMRRLASNPHIHINHDFTVVNEMAALMSSEAEPSKPTETPRACRIAEISGTFVIF
jgi:hypothetical protein